MSTGIEWTDETWNPVVGCTKVSPGCANCYAERMSKRLAAMASADLLSPGRKSHYLNVLTPAGKWNGQVELVPEALTDPIGWKKPRRIFVNSMSDLFHEDVPFDFIDRVFSAMALCRQHSFQILTKRPKRMREYLADLASGSLRVRAAADDMDALRFSDHVRNNGWCWPLPNVWLGTSVENQACADDRRKPMKEIAEAGWLTWVSNEPALEPVDWMGWEFIRWMVSGGESGPGARPAHPAYFRAARDFCADMGIAFFFKQWGEFGAGSEDMTTGEPVFRQFSNHQQWVNKASTWVNGGVCLDARGKTLKNGDDFDTAQFPVTIVHKIGKKTAGRMLDGKEHNAFPVSGGGM